MALKPIAPQATGAVVVPYIAQTASKGISEALTADLAVMRFQSRPRGKRAPIDYELHLNPAAIGVGVVGIGLALWLAQLRLHPMYSEDGRVAVTLQQRQGFGLDSLSPVDVQSWGSFLLHPKEVLMAGSPLTWLWSLLGFGKKRTEDLSKNVRV